MRRRPARAVSYNGRRLEPRNINEDADSLPCLRRDRRRAADSLHRRYPQLGCMRAVDAKQAGRNVVGYAAGHASGRGDSRFASGGGGCDRASAGGVRGGGFGSARGFRSNCGFGSGSGDGLGRTVDLRSRGGFRATRCFRRQGRREARRAEENQHTGGRRVHIPRRSTGCIPLARAGEAGHAGRASRERGWLSSRRWPARARGARPFKFSAPKRRLEREKRPLSGRRIARRNRGKDAFAVKER